MTQVTIPVGLGGDGLPFSDDGSSARDMLGQGYASNFFPMVNQTLNAVQTAVTASAAISNTSTNTTSTTSNTIGTGSKTFTVQTGKSIVPGMYYIMANTDVVNNYMVGQVLSYNTGTGELALAVEEISGSGTFSAWTGSVTAVVVKEGQVGDVVYSLTAPVGSGWLPCDGKTYLKSAYPELSDKLGSIFNNYFGVGTQVTTLPGTKTPSALKWLNNQFVYLTSSTTDSSQVYTSPNGITWTARASAQTNTWQDVTYDPISGYYIAVASTGTNRVMRSLDAITWITASASEATTWQKIASNTTGTLVACASAGTNQIMYSTNGGASWTGVNVGSLGLRTVLWDGTRFCAFGAASVVFSADGITWTASASFSTPGGNLSSVVWTGKYFVMIDNSQSSLLSSADGINWSYIPNSINRAVTGYNAGIQYIDYLKGNLIVLHAASTVATGITITITNDLTNWYSGWLYSNGDAFSPTRIGMSPAGVLVGISAAAGPNAYRKSLSYDTSTQFVVPSLGLNNYIKAE